MLAGWVLVEVEVEFVRDREAYEEPFELCANVRAWTRLADVIPRAGPAPPFLGRLRPALP